MSLHLGHCHRRLPVNPLPLVNCALPCVARVGFPNVNQQERRSRLILVRESVHRTGLVAEIRTSVAAEKENNRLAGPELSERYRCTGTKTRQRKSRSRLAWLRSLIVTGFDGSEKLCGHLPLP